MTVGHVRYDAGYRGVLRAERARIGVDQSGKRETKEYTIMPMPLRQP